MDLENNIKICFISDNKYALATAVAITSILENKAENSIYRISILGVGLSDENQQMFLALASEKLLVEIINLEENKDFSKLKKENMHVSTAALYKFILADVFKDDDKILYLDGDIIVKRDLQELFNTDVDGYYAAVVKDLKAVTYRPSQIIKLGLNHTAYFNSGVILFNLKKLREDGISKKLIDYRKSGLNFFMDQDTFNVVFEEKVKYISFFNNVIMSNLGYFDLFSLNDYYAIKSLSKEEIVTKATIVHFASPYKPWDYKGVPFEKLWLKYYSIYLHSNIEQINSSKKLCRREMEQKSKEKLFNEVRFQEKSVEMKMDVPVIISLTTYSKRIHVVDKVINSMLNQTVSVDKIILWLSSDEFAEDKSTLPEALLKLESDKFEIVFCEDIGPHKKYFFTMQKYPESIVITVDDDIYYPSNLVERLLDSFARYPYAVSAIRGHLIDFDYNGNILPYSEWKQRCKIDKIPSLALFATGCGGVLYPPHSMHRDLFELDIIKKYCLMADDLWLKIMQVLQGTPVVICDRDCSLSYIEDTQDMGLFNNNVDNNQNDVQLSELLRLYNNYYGEQDTLLWRMRISSIALKNIKSYGHKTGRKSGNSNNRRSVMDIIKGGIQCYKEHGLIYTLTRIKQKVKL